MGPQIKRDKFSEVQRKNQALACFSLPVACQFNLTKTSQKIHNEQPLMVKLIACAMCVSENKHISSKEEQLCSN